MFSLKQTIFESEDRLWHVAWSKDGSLLATCGSDRMCRIWSDGKLLCVLEDAHSRTVRSCEFSPIFADGRLLLCTASFDATCVIWEKTSSPQDSEEEKMWTSVATLEGHENEVKSITWSSDGLFLATCGRDKTCWVWEARDDEDNGKEAWSCLSVLNGHEQDVKFVLFHPTEYLLLSCSYDNSIRVWEYVEDEHDFTLSTILNGHENTVWGCTFVSDDMFVSCSQDLTCKTWSRNPETSKWNILYSIPSSHSHTIFSIDSVFNWVITGGGDNMVYLREVNTETGFINEGSALKLVAHDQDVNCVRFSPMSSAHHLIFATTSDDGTVKVWTIDV